MCQHQPPCPSADAADREAAHPMAYRPEQGWFVNCTFVSSLSREMSACSRRFV